MHAIALALTILAAEPASPLPEVQLKARAYSIETSALGGGSVLRANDHVDIVAVMTDDSKRLVSVTLLQNVIVMANAAPAPGEAKVVSLLVIPEEAELLAVAQLSGKLLATVRNPRDTDVLEERGVVTVANAISGQREPKAAKPAKR